jgi:hypothetical protein
VGELDEHAHALPREEEHVVERAFHQLGDPRLQRARRTRRRELEALHVSAQVAEVPRYAVEVRGTK